MKSEAEIRAINHRRASQVKLAVKDPPANARDIRNEGSIPESGRSPGGEHSNPLQYSCLENPMDRGVWRATLHGVAKSQTLQTKLVEVMEFQLSYSKS